MDYNLALSNLKGPFSNRTTIDSFIKVLEHKQSIITKLLIQAKNIEEVKYAQGQYNSLENLKSLAEEIKGKDDGRN